VLTPSEATAVRQLISRSEPRLVDLPGAAPLPRRTFQTIRQRVYQRGWIRDRFLPSPSRFGVERVTIALVAAHADKAASLVGEWRARPENVLLWASDDSVLGVFLSRRGSGESLSGVLEAEGTSRESYVLEVDGRPEAIPSYFDFEAAWVRATGLSGLTGYPRSLFGPSGGPGGSGPAELLPSHRRAVEELLRATSEPLGPAEERPITSRLFQRRAEERLVRLGWVSFRSFLDPAAVAGSVSGFPSWLAFVHGSLLPGAGPPELFRALVGECGVGPFLYVTDDRELLFATLSRGPGAPGEPGRAPVLPTVRTYLEDIDVVRWPLVSTRVVTDHAFGRLLGHGP